jgi:hypothetical protein
MPTCHAGTQIRSVGVGGRRSLLFGVGGGASTDFCFLLFGQEAKLGGLGLGRLGVGGFSGSGVSWMRWGHGGGTHFAPQLCV